MHHDPNKDYGVLILSCSVLVGERILLQDVDTREVKHSKTTLNLRKTELKQFYNMTESDPVLDFVVLFLNRPELNLNHIFSFLIFQLQYFSVKIQYGNLIFQLFNSTS